MKKEDCYLLGKITKTHGLSGSVVLKLDTDQPETYEKLQSIFIEINGLLAPFFIEKQQWTKDNSKIISFKNGSLAQSEQTVGKNVFLPLADLPPLSGSQFYYHEVIGYTIFDENLRSCGTIQHITDQTAQPFFELQLSEKPVIIPIIKDWILEVNRDEKFIKMLLPDGLLDVFLKPGINDEKD